MEPVTFLKAKFTRPKPVSGYKSAASASSHAKKKRNKKGPKDKPTFRTIMVLNPLSGKSSWVREAL